MRVIFLNLEGPTDKCINKDFAGGFGTTFRVGNTWRGKLLERLKQRGLKLPLLSMAYLVSIFRNAGHEVSVLTNRLPEEPADLILFPSSLVDYKQELRTGRELRKRYPGCVGIFGTFASERPDVYEGAYDFLIRGEPECAAMQIAENGSPPLGIVDSPPVENLDELPFPAWDLFPIHTYKYRPTLPRRPVLTILGSRGCPYICNYCPYIVQIRKFRYRSVENVIAELHHIKQKYSVGGIIFRDPIFTMNRNRTIRLMLRMIEERLNLEWGCETRLDRLDTELIDLMKEAGLRDITVGIESASAQTLKHVKRIPISIQHQEEIVKYCKGIGVKMVAFYVLGLPTDTEKTVRETMAYSKRLNTYAASFTIATPMPGSGMFEEIKDRIFTRDWERFNTFTPVWHHPLLRPSRLTCLRERAFVSYYFRLQYLFSHCWHLLSFAAYSLRSAVSFPK